MPDTTTATVEQRVQVGANWLDEHEPGWVDRIDVDRLELKSPCQCVLGQLHDGDFWAGDRRTGYKSEQLGFAAEAESLPLPDDENEWGAYDTLAASEYAELTAAWRQLIETRRAGA